MKEIITRQVDSLDVRAQFVPTTLNEENRTIEVVFATGTPVRTFTWEDGTVEEILSFDTGHVRMDRLENGAPVLDNHNRYEGTASVLGTVENAKIVNGQGIATLRFSKRDEVSGVWQDVKDGILRGISVGYRVYKYEVTKEDGKLPIYRAVDWEPYEISIAPVQADIKSQVRSDQKTNEVEINRELKTKQNKMENNEKTAAELAKENAENQRKQKELQDAAVVGERNRVSEINDMCRKANLASDFSEKLVKDGTNVEAARALVIDEVAKVNETNITNQNRNLSVGEEASEKIRKGMIDAIEHRVNPSIQLTDLGREFRGSSLIDMARKCVEEKGHSTTGLTKREVAMLAFGFGERGYVGTSDLPYVLGASARKTLQRAYSLQSPTFNTFCTRGTFVDFKEKEVLDLTDVSKMEKVQEGGEYKYGKMSDSVEKYKAVKYGKIIPITWEAIVNDDLSALSRIPTSIANNARQLQSDIVYGILSTNAAMGDGVALFHASHGNLAGTGTVINVASLQAARVAMRTQKNINNDALNLVPKYLVVGPAKEMEAYQYTSSQFVPAKNSDINPIYNTQLQVIVDARITGNEWYLVADPSMIDTIEYSFLDGEGELFTEQRVGFDIDGMELKARMVFGAKAINWRGLYKNAGA